MSDLTLIEQMKYFLTQKILLVAWRRFRESYFGSKGSNVLELRSANAGDVIKFSNSMW